MKIISVILFMLATVSFALTAAQTDWSGGDGTSGPVTDWGKNYNISDQIEITGDSLRLVSTPLTAPKKHMVRTHFNGTVSVYATDLDGDGDTDVLGAAMYDNNITWWENADGTGTVWTEHTVDNDFDGAFSVFAIDVDGDGDTDILGAASDANNITWWENTGGSPIVWTKHTVEDNLDVPLSVFAADVDGDGDTDILGAVFKANEILWWENTSGTGSAWVKHTVDSNFTGSRSVFAADVDGDGDTDILGAASNGYDITWWENTNGTGTVWTEHIVDKDFDGASSIFATDVDGDGDTDILGAAIHADDITWWENTNGTGTVWTEHTVDGNFDGAYTVYAADVDDDGDTDVVGAGSVADEIAWWENIGGTGTSWVKHTLDTNFDHANAVFASDIDGDGDTDILGGAFHDDEIAWWDKESGSQAGMLESSILDAKTVNSWDLFASSEVEPAGTSVGYQFRSSNNSTNMGAWSDTVFATTSSLAGILASSTNFLQYKIILQTTDATVTPVVNDVTFNYTPGSVAVDDNNNSGITRWNLAPGANPSFSNCSVIVSAQEEGMVDLVLHDVTGRRISEYSQELPAGTHSVSFDNIAQGVYFCTMYAEDFTATERMVILK